MQKFLFAQNLAGRGGGRCENGGDVAGELPQKITEKEVKKMGKAVLLDALKRLNSVELKVLEMAIEQLGKGTARLDYVAIARAAGTSRQAVSYNVKKFVSAGLLVSHGVLGFSVPDGIMVQV